MRIGIGYDIHRLVTGRRLVLGGVEIPGPVGLLGHSDGDAVLHAVIERVAAITGEAAQLSKQPEGQATLQVQPIEAGHISFEGRGSA